MIFGSVIVQLLRQHLLRALLVGEREIVALDRRLEEPLELVALARVLQRAGAHGDAAEQPRHLLGGEVDQDVDALFAREGGERLVEHRGLDLARLHRGEPRRSAADIP